MNVKVSRPSIDESDRAAVLEALAASEISGTSGTFIPRFEREFAEYCGCAQGVATANGTVALHLAFAALGIGPGDEVLVSTFTNMASVFAILYTGATPVPVDIESDTWNIDPMQIGKKITPRTKAIEVVHVYGHPADMDPILAVAKKHHLFVVEDAAEAHGAEYRGKRVGSFGDIACFSFYANKIITTGEGGMVVTNDGSLAARARSLKSLAYGTEQRFMHTAVGFNYRMTNLQAALGTSQLKRIEAVIAQKREIAEFYRNRLQGIEGLQLPVEKPYAKNVYWMYHVVLHGRLAGRRAAVRQALTERGVETREAFVPANMQRIFIEKGIVREDDCPVANEVGRNGFYLPSGPTLAAEELEYVVAALGEAAAGAR